MGAVPMAPSELTFATLGGETTRARRLVQLCRRQAEAHDAQAFQDEDRRRARAPRAQAVMRRA
jgi:hypothetical protein